MSEIKLVGYSSDDLFPQDDNIWFIYLVNGIKRYYKLELDLSLFPDHLFLRKETKKRFYSSKNEGKTVKLPSGNNVLEENYFCCYCEDKLTPDNQTRDHLIARDRGGKNNKRNLRPCCRECNEEKDNFMLKTYIQILEINQSYQIPGTPEYNRSIIKINNANKILKETQEWVNYH